MIAALQAIERATGGWGLSIAFFRVPYLLNGGSPSRSHAPGPASAGPIPA